MNSEEIEKFLTEKTTATEIYVKIDFKKRDTIYGLFVKDKDYGDLKSKNFWRIVPQSRLAAYEKSKDINLSRIFLGSDFQKLTFVTNKEEE